MQSSSFFPEEIIVDILSRLPAKSIGRCRCVSKPWRSLLSQTHFIRSHLDRTRKLQEKSLVLVSNSGYLYSLALRNAHHLFDEMTDPAGKLSFADHPNSWIRVRASCDGLVLVEDKECKKFLVNPVTREIKKVPPSPSALDHSDFFTVCGLGYDSVNDDYKIVTLSYYNRFIGYEPDSTETFVNVYSVKNGSWKKAESSPYDHTTADLTPGVFVDGYIHWLACETKSYSSVIVAFDLAKEKFYEVPPPNSIGKFELDSLVKLEGCLCMSISDCINETEVWVMNEYGIKDSWTNFTIIHSEEVVFWPLCMFGQEQVVLLKDGWAPHEKLV